MDIKNIFQSFSNNFSPKTTYDYQVIIKNISHELILSVNSKYTCKFVIDILFTTLQLKSAYFLTIDDQKYKTEYFRIYKDKNTDKEGIFDINQTQEIIYLLKEKRNIIIKEKLFEEIEQTNKDKLKNELKSFLGEVLVPIFIDNNLSAILLLGKKQSSDPFSSDDINLLQTISNQVSISLKNYGLYDKLETLVEQRTEELSISNKLLRDQIAMREGAEARLIHQAYYDSITNLPNKIFFIERLKSLIEFKKRYPEHMFAVLFMDLDRFKVINESLGHTAGDNLLIMISERIKRVIRKIDTAARFGGDEFVLLLGKLKNTDDVQYVANRIHRLFQIPFKLEGKEIFISFSIGIITSESINSTNPEEFIQNADIALYVAKERGRACHVVFEKNMNTKAVSIFSQEDELRKAIAHNELIINYQPLMSLDNNKIIGFESLLRWKHPDKGLLLPAEFLQIAEETELIVDIDKWVIKEVLTQMNKWQKKFTEIEGLYVSINISNKMFLKKDFSNFVNEMLKKTNFSGNKLRFEINESIITNDFEVVLSTINRLQAMGINIDIDEFGSGNSVLSYLRRLPINGLKIGYNLISTLTSNKFNEEIVRTIIKLAQTLNLDIVAKGIETQNQLSAFKDMNGKYIQGFFVNKPMNISEIENLFSNKKSE